jgi:hypothetical protein
MIVVKLQLSSPTNSGEENSPSAASVRPIDAQLQKLIVNVPAVIRKYGQLSEMWGDVAVISHVVRDNVPDPFSFMREKGKSRAESGPWHNASESIVRRPVVTERNDMPFER